MSKTDFKVGCLLDQSLQLNFDIFLIQGFWSKTSVFKGRNDRGRLFNPTVEEMKDHQREEPGKRFSDDSESGKKDMLDREL